MNNAEIDDIIRQAVSGCIGQEYEEYARRVGRACEAGYMLNHMNFLFNSRLTKRDYTLSEDRVNVSKKNWLTKTDDERKALLRRIVCEIVDKELHGSKSGGWEFLSLTREVERKLGVGHDR